MNLFFKIVFFIIVYFIITILLSGDYTDDSKAILSLFFISCLISLFVRILLKNNKHSTKIAFLLIVLVNILFLMNTTGWNEGTMSGTSYIIPYFQYISDWLYGILLISAFMAFTPILLYFILIYSIVVFFCRIKNQNSKEIISKN
ncbi:hypothetical protein [Arcobacter sp. F2176]|uniref:hypothetical protein n=1 Tax=Arcobacter sp. F2176 TaxID=2044511 RepID=UPI00100B55F5|nr:hypothetical protein [Arcobacter sp. F2176]RXJ79415.1 hypothetical protein CRU95_14415 [Arcobacter sp. F2176]